jgi:glutamine amidotransferase
MVAIIDYGVGNLMAIQNILKKVGHDSVITSDPQVISQSDSLILPGVGSFDYCAAQLESRQLRPVLELEVLSKKKKVLGLCVGAQLMTRSSEEGNVAGLGWVQAKTVRFREVPGYTIPHMGWTDVTFLRPGFLGSGFDSNARFYFVHSYHFEFEQASEILAMATHGYPFACAFQKGNICGVQFHPEKSHSYGMKLFKNFLAE